MGKKVIFGLFFFIFLLSFTSASSFGYNYLEGETVFTGGNYTINVNNSLYWRGLGTPADISHSLLDNLEWSVAGHTMDANLDMNANDILNVGNLDVNENLTVEGNSLFNGDVIVDAWFTIFNMPNPGLRIIRDDDSINVGETIGVVTFRGGDRDTGDSDVGAYIKTTADGTWNGGSDNPAIFEIFVENEGITNGLGIPMLELNGTSKETTFKGDIMPRTTLAQNIGSGEKRWNILYVGNVSADSVEVSGDVTANSFIGSGAYLTDLNVSGVMNVTGDFTGYAINISLLQGANGIGGMDLRGDPWYLGGVDLELSDNLIVGGNITASYFFGDGSGLTNINHNSLSGLQGGGGEGTEYYHLDSIAYDSAMGFLDGSNWYDNNLVIMSGINLTFLNGNITASNFFGNFAGTWNGSSGYLLNTGDTASGDYNFDSNTLFVDSNNGRVGIGTTSPSYS